MCLTILRQARKFEADTTPRIIREIHSSPVGKGKKRPSNVYGGTASSLQVDLMVAM